MKWTSAIALLLAVSAGGAGVAVVATREPKAPLEVLEEVRSEMKSSLFDRNASLASLDRLIEGRRSELEPEVAAELLRTRATLYKDLESYERARSDLELLLSSYRPDDNELRLEIAELQSLEDQVFDALERTRGLTRRDPSFGEAWALQGSLEEKLADQTMAEIAEITDLGLSSSKAERAMELVIELAARDVVDPERGDLTYQLGRAFETGRESDYEEVLDLLREPRLGYKRARDAYARALATEVSPDTVIALSDSFQRAGQLDLAIQLQHAARALPEIYDDPDVAASLMKDLVDAQRKREAQGLIQDWNWQLDASLEFYRFAGEVLLKAGLMAPLGRVGAGLDQVGGENGPRWGQYFFLVRTIDVASQLSDRTERVRTVNRVLPLLFKWTNDELASEPFFQARKLALFYLADGFRMVGDVTAERKTLVRALEAMPKHSPEAYVRYAETLRLSPRSVPWKEIEEALSKAMNLDPDLSESIAPMWFEAGEMALRKMGTTVKAQINQALQGGSFLPFILDLGPSVLTQIAQDHLDNGRYYGAIQAAEEARKKFPNLVPPLDIIIAAELATPEKYNVSKEIVERIELAGVDEKVEGFLAALPGRGLEGEWLVRAIRAAPIRVGKAAVARWYLDRGDSEGAGRALEGIDDNTAPAELRLIRAQLLMESGKFGAAIAELDRTQDLPRIRSRRDTMRLQALIGAGREADLPSQLRAMSSYLPPSAPAMLEAVDILAGAGKLELALGIVNRMDQNAASRTPGFYRRRLIVDLLLSSTQGSAKARESILRAEPYLRDGSPELAAILLAVSERNWTQLPRLVQRIDASDFVATEYERAALLLLGEKLEQGSRMTSAAAEQNPRDARWALLNAAATALVDGSIKTGPWFGPGADNDAERLLRGRDARSAKDPRDTLAMLLTLRHGEYLAWSAPRIDKQVASTGSTMWGPLLQVSVAETEGRSADVERLITRIQGSSPRFGPAHDLAIELAVAAHPTEPLHPDVVRARARRLDSMGAELIDNEVELRIARAGKLARTAKYGEAVKELLPIAKNEGPDATEGRMMLSLFQLRAGQPGFAAMHLHRAAMGELGRYREAALTSLVNAIELSLDNRATGQPERGALTIESARHYLRTLSTRYPLDPLLALADLKLLDVEAGERGRRAKGIIKELQIRAGDLPFDALREGATRAWVEFLTPVAADVAADLVESELIKDAGNVELLQLAGMTAEAQGDLERAEREYTTLLSIESRAETCYALAELLVSRGGSAERVAKLLTQANRLLGGPSVRSLYLRSRADLQVVTPQLGALIDRLRNMWHQRQRSADEVEPVDIGLLYADALMRRHKEEDLIALGELIEELAPMVANRLYDEPFLDALEGIRTATLAQTQ